MESRLPITTGILPEFCIRHADIMTDYFVQKPLRHIFTAVIRYRCPSSVWMDKPYVRTFLTNRTETKALNPANEFVEGYGRAGNHTASWRSRTPTKREVV